MIGFYRLPGKLLIDRSELLFNLHQSENDGHFAHSGHPSAAHSPDKREFDNPILNHQPGFRESETILCSISSPDLEYGCQRKKQKV